MHTHLLTVTIEGGHPESTGATEKPQSLRMATEEEEDGGRYLILPASREFHSLNPLRLPHDLSNCNLAANSTDIIETGKGILNSGEVDWKLWQCCSQFRYRLPLNYTVIFLSY